MLFLTIGCEAPFRGPDPVYKQFGLPVKMTCILLTCFLLRVNANTNPRNLTGAKSNAEKVTFSGKNVPLEKLFNVIEDQTGYVVFYNSAVVQNAKPVTIHVKDIPLEQFLENCLSNQGLKYVIEGKTILITKNDLTTVSETVPVLPSPVDVHGHVSDSLGNPMSGATVLLKGTKLSVTTDLSGNFSMSAPEHSTLIVSYIGYKSQEILVNGTTLLSVSMQELSKGFDEVVVVGYQSQRRSDITGAVSVVNVGDVSRIPIGFADQALQGQAAGVRVTQSTGQPGDGVAIRIRGVGTINNNDPLYIIDGVPTMDGINFLSSNDIATITVLKDAASAAIYGSRAANGVVVITTKSGKAGKTQITYNGFYGIQTHGTSHPWSIIRNMSPYTMRRQTMIMPV
jgi:TonB-dependent starch-binding outer membrane protein SusC